MKNISAELAAHLAQEVTTLVTCVKVILTKYQPRIVAITKADPGVVETAWPHRLETGDVVRLVGVRGMISVNRQEYQITRIDQRRFSIDADTSGLGAYASKGEVRKVIGFTQYRKDLTFEKVRYRATMAYTPQSLKQGSDGSVDSVDVQGVLQNAALNELRAVALDGINDEDLAAGRYDNAAVEMFLLNYLDLTMGRLILAAGAFGETTLHRGVYEAQLSGKLAALQETLQEVYTRACRADLGDDLDGSDPAHELQQGFGCKVRLDPPAWQAATAYTLRPVGDAGVGGVVRPTVFNGRHFRVTVAGTSGAAEPAWNLTLGATTIDGSTTWKAIQALTVQGVVYSVIDRRRFIDAGRSEAPVAGAGGAATLFPITAINQGAHRFTIAGHLAAQLPANARFEVLSSAANDGTYTVVSAADATGPVTNVVVGEDIDSSIVGGSILGRLPALSGFFNFGKVTFTSGRNIGISREVRSFSVSSDDGATFHGPGMFELFEALPFDIEPGVTYEAHAGCDKSLTMCVQRFDNVHNRRAEDNIPGMDAALLYPDAK